MPDEVGEAGLLPLIVVSSVPREPAYIHQTLASLFMSDPLVHRTRVHVMVDSPDASYLADYAHHPNFSALPLTADEARRTADYWVHRRCAHNYHRCLALPCDGYSGLCICEDDVVFCHGFLRELQKVIAEIEAKRYAKDYVLAGYTPYRFEPDGSQLDGRAYCRYRAADFYGNQCVYFPLRVLPKFAPWFYERAVEQAEAPSDMVLKEYCLHSAELLACRRSLAQHIGRITTGLGDFHTSPTFDGVSSV